MQSVENAPLQCLEHCSPVTNAGDAVEPPAIPSSLSNVVPSQPVKRPTRQWAAWTREEEEIFFTALRQVGKNFEKITCRVQSKNKDQVRHYYYRLVRRMNKLLPPILSLDAKNSKDTNAAMLRWWSLLVKYSCKASKLHHLKPRRFKSFLEELEHQLLKDRKKNVKKQALHGENYSSSPTSTNQNNMSANDARAVKIVVGDSKSAQKVGPGRGSSARRSSNMGVIRSSNKVESSHAKPTRQRRKSAAIKRWEKAAMAGVSLVADAAEHLERTAGENHIACQEQTDSGPSVQVQVNSSNLSKSVAIEDNVQATMKFKLQLFPIDESTRKALEMDKHYPYLELILSTRKKISSILEHLGRKWGNSSVMSGELMLFPLNIQRENLARYQRWTRDSAVTAAEVYAMLGSPEVFRLRYGWISSTELQSCSSQTIPVSSFDFDVHENRTKEALREHSMLFTEERDKLEKLADHFLDNHQTLEKQHISCNESTAAISDEAKQNADVHLSNGVFEMHNVGLSVLSKRKGACNESTLMKMKKVADQRARKCPSLSTREWAGSFTNASAGNLLTEDIGVMDVNGVETPAFRSSQCTEAVPFTCDSFDAAIAAHIYSQNKIGFSGPPPHSSSIWDAEETCDAFSFQNRVVSNNQAASSTASTTASVSIAGADIFMTGSGKSGPKVQDSQEGITAKENNPSETHETESSAKDFASLTDIYWPDSLGPLELDVPSCKYYSEDLILGDSMSSLNRLLASSLDAFQNCSFFGLEEKRPASSATGTQRGASFAGKFGKSDDAGVQSLEVSTFGG